MYLDNISCYPSAHGIYAIIEKWEKNWPEPCHRNYSARKSSFALTWWEIEELYVFSALRDLKLKWRKYIIKIPETYGDRIGVQILLFPLGNFNSWIQPIFFERLSYFPKKIPEGAHPLYLEFSILSYNFVMFGMLKNISLYATKDLSLNVP